MDFTGSITSVYANLCDTIGICGLICEILASAGVWVQRSLVDRQGSKVHQRPLQKLIVVFAYG